MDTGDLPAISLHAPWATAVAAGLKRYETRHWPCPPRYTGRTVAIHQAKRTPYERLDFGDRWRTVKGAGSRWWLEPVERVHTEHGTRLRAADRTVDGTDGRILLPLGAIVATARIRACLPIVHDIAPTDRTEWITADPWSCSLGHVTIDTGRTTIENVTDDAPWGDYTPGRYAWHLTDVHPLPVPVPTVGRQGFWTLPVDTAAEVRLAAAASQWATR